MRIVSTSFLFGHYKGLPSMNLIFTRVSFFLLHRTLFRGLARASVNPGRFSLFVHSLVCPITHSFLHGFQPNLVQHLPHVCSTCYTFFSLKNTFECVCERLLHPWQMICINFQLHNLRTYIDVSFCTEKKISGLSFSKLSFKVASAYMLL